MKKVCGCGSGRGRKHATKKKTMRLASLGDPGPAQSHILSFGGAHILLDAGLDLEAGAWLVPPGTEAAAAGGGAHAAHPHPHPLLPLAPAFKAALFEASPDATGVTAILATSAAGLLGLPYALQACCGAPGAPPPAILAPDWAVDAAVAWVADLGAASASAAAAGWRVPTPPSSSASQAGGGPWTDAHLPPQAVRALPPDMVTALLGPTAAAALAAEPADTLPASPLPPAAAAGRAAWRAGPYPAPAALAALATVRRVSYGEPVPLLPGGRLVATARPSGAGPGGAAWEVEAPAAAATTTSEGSVRRVVYLAGAALPPPPLPDFTDPADAVEALTAALGGAAAVAAPMEVGALRGADVLIFAPPAPPPPALTPARLAGGPATLAAAAAAVDAVSAGGCALLPIHPDGAGYALVEATAGALRARGLGHLPLFVVGPGAERSLAAGVSGGEWFAPPRRALLFAGRPPIGAGDLRARGQLIVAAGLAELAQCRPEAGGRPAPTQPQQPRWRAPAVVFAPAASLRGDGVADGGPGATAAALARAWADDARSALILTHPVGHEGSPAATAAPFAGSARVVDASPPAGPGPAAAAALVAALAPRLAVISPVAWEEALAGAVAAGAAPAPGCGGAAARLVTLARGVTVGEEEEGGGGPAWPADVDPALLAGGGGDDDGRAPRSSLIVSLSARDGRVGLAPPPPPAAAAAGGGGGGGGGSGLMATALGPRPGPPAACLPSVDGILASLRARGLRAHPSVATEPADVAVLAAADRAAGAALAAAAGAGAGPSSTITALIALPAAGAAIVLAPGGTHIHAESGIVRETVAGAVLAACSRPATAAG